MSFRLDWVKRRKWVETYKLQGRELGLAGRDHREGTKEGEAVRPVVFQLLCAVPPALGTPGLRIRPTACSGQAVCHLTPLPPGLSTEKASVSFLESGSTGHVWGQVYSLAGKADSRGAEGRIKCSVPQGPLQGWGAGQLSLTPPSWLPCRITKESHWSLNTKCLYQYPPAANLHSVLSSTTVSGLHSYGGVCLTALRGPVSLVSASVAPWAPGGQRMQPHA